MTVAIIWDRPMSIALYIVAACIYIAANLILLRMLSAAGNRSTLLANPCATPAQTKRFLAFGLLLFITFCAIVAGDQLSSTAPF